MYEFSASTAAISLCFLERAAETIFNSKLCIGENSEVFLLLLCTFVFVVYNAGTFVVTYNLILMLSFSHALRYRFGLHDLGNNICNVHIFK